MDRTIFRQWMAYERTVWERHQDDRATIFRLSLDYLASISPDALLEHAQNLESANKPESADYRHAVLAKRDEVLTARRRGASDTGMANEWPVLWSCRMTTSAPTLTEATQSWQDLSSAGRLVIPVRATSDSIVVMIEPCPFCGQHHRHGRGYRGGEGHRLAHCVAPTPGAKRRRALAKLSEWRPVIRLNDGSKVTVSDGYYLKIFDVD